jgi:hypothetical protein
MFFGFSTSIIEVLSNEHFEGIMLRSGFDGSGGGSWRLVGYRRPPPLWFKVFPATDRLPPGFQK